MLDLFSQHNSFADAIITDLQFHSEGKSFVTPYALLKALQAPSSVERMV